MLDRIPTNVVTGFLGVGKTTAVLDLLARKNPAERWAVLVNEYGEVSIDEAILSGGGSPGVTVREVSGGCVCCTTAPYLQVALHLLLTEAKPHRLIVETTGLGHPSGLIERLRAGHNADRLDVRATLTIVSPDDFTTPGMRETNSVFREQIELADVLVLNKLDRADAATVAEFQRWGNDLFPPKQLVVATEQGQLNPAWLDVGSTRSGLRLMPSTVPELASPGESEPDLPEPGRPIRSVSTGSAPACGWVFHPNDVFDEGKLLRFLGQLPKSGRLKGVFHVPDDWIVVNRVGSQTTVTPTQYRRDSRVEIFAEDGVHWDGVERSLKDCLHGG